MPDATRTLLGFDPARLKLPEKPALEGLESKWMPRWEESGVYRFDRTRSRADVYAIDTPPPTVSGSLHVGHVFSFTHTDLVARFHRMRGRMVFYPMGWDDNGLPTAAPTAAEAADLDLASELHRAVRAAHGRGREGVRAPLEVPRPVGRLVDDVRHDRQTRPARLAAGVPAPARTQACVSGGSADSVGRRFQDGRRAGGARGPRGARCVLPHQVRAG